MTLGVGARLGNYEIVGPLGAGGMGEVYRARDFNLKREVAIKVLPETFSHDTERVARLRREAEVLASLNHSHIAAIYDFVESGTSPFLVLELVEGDTLADRLARGRLPCREALAIARQIAEALEAAHDRGIIHRDLKPANIKVTPDGNVKVLDFGLAKAIAEGGAPHLSHASTLMATTPGMILGTAAYMSPEQANGREADRGSDVWAFGCVLYEMLTGHRAFDGETASEILAGVLRTEPDWRRLPAETPGGIQRLLRRSLQKDQKLRFRDIRDAGLEMDDVQNATSQGDGVTSVRPAGRERLVWASALLLLAVLAGVLGVWALRPAPTAPELRLEINTPPTSNPGVAISPDGLKIVFVAGAAGQSQLWLRSLDSPSARPLPGTERAASPFWSPDSRSLGFFADTSLKRMDIDGGSLQTLASDSPVAFGGTWSGEGTIVFSRSPGGPLLRISAGGGEPTPATRIQTAQERGHAFPRFLPDGRHFLFFATGSPEVRGVYVGQLDHLNGTRLVDADTPAVYSPTGHLLFVRAGRLLAQAFDPDRLELKGAPLLIAEPVTVGTTLSASAAGPIAYRTGDSGQRQLVWVDRSGREIDKEVYPDSSALGPSLSPDGRRIAVYRETNGNMDVWSYETTRRAWDRITSDPGDDIFPLWSRDGTSVVTGSARKAGGVVDLYRKLLSAPQGNEELLLSTSQEKFPMDLSADGRFLLFTSLDPKSGFDIWALPLQGDRKPFEVVRTDFNEGLPQFSPDGGWIAYQSNKTGRSEVYVRPFRGSGEDLRASIDGGGQARWSPNGQELFYVGADGRLMVVPIRFPSNGKDLEFGTAVGLFATSMVSAGPVYRQQYLVSADGRSFVMNSVVGDANASPITVILNWRPKKP